MSDKERAFLDTNTDIYLFSDDEPQKKQIVEREIDKYNCVISTQVINEFSNVCIKKLGKSIEEIQIVSIF
jgi:predicted nucleic acid-binding protein